MVQFFYEAKLVMQDINESDAWNKSVVMWKFPKK